jgi:hypothetical protein
MRTKMMVQDLENYNIFVLTLLFIIYKRINCKQNID